MNTTLITTTPLQISYKTYSVVIPISIAFAILSVLISGLILIFIVCHARIHTVNHLLIANTCIWSILYSAAQSNQFIHVLFVQWDTSDISCRWRAYLAYVSMAGIIYSYLIQSISRLFFIILAMKYRWTISFRCHFILICIQWIISFSVPLPAIVTEDVIFVPHVFCWVSLSHPLHVIYTYTVFYAIPTILVFFIYAYVCYRTKFSTTLLLQRRGSIQQQSRDYIVFRNIIIVFGIYLLAGTPTAVHIITHIDIFYFIGISFISFGVATKSLAVLFLDRELFHVFKTRFRRKTTRVVPFTSYMS